MICYDCQSILQTLHSHGIKTKNGYQPIIEDVRKAVAVMQKKHSNCRWIDYDKKNLQVEHEGYLWIETVYFNTSKTIIDADVTFFENLIEMYSIYFDKNNISYFIPEFVSKDMTFKEISQFTNRSIDTIRKAYYKLPIFQKKLYYIDNTNTKHISASVIDKLCKQYFINSYINYLELIYVNMKNILQSTKGDVANVLS